METSYQTNDVLDERRPNVLPGMLNVLTILTFIGCGLGYIFACWGYISSSPEKIAQAQEKRDQLQSGGFVAKMMDDSINMAQVSYDNKTLLLATNLICITLCLIGAIQMRKLKKPGFFMYLVGELAPVFLLGGLLSSITNVSLVFSFLFAMVFVILYATQLKHLINK